MTYGQPYATCSSCRQPFALTKGGNMYPHNGPRGARCAGRLPLKDHRLGYDEPCLICGAPINRDGEGHDDGCMGLDS